MKYSVGDFVFVNKFPIIHKVGNHSWESIFYGKWVRITEIINRPDCIYEAEDRTGYIYTIAEKDINQNRTEKQKVIYLSKWKGHEPSM